MNYRNIATTFWEDSKIDDDFTPEDKYFYLYLLTNPHTNICGCYEVGKKQMERETGYTWEVVEKLLYRMQDVHDVIAYDPRTKEVLIYNWSKYNWSKSEKMLTAVRKVTEHIKTDRFRSFVSEMTERVAAGDRTQITDHRLQNTDNSTQITEHSTQNTVSDTDVSIVYGYHTDRVSKPKKSKYGEFNHVMLTEEEFNKLCDEYGDTKTLGAIKFLDEYIEEKGYKAKSHYLSIRRWVMDAVTKPNKSTGSSYIDAIKNRFDTLDDWYEETTNG